MHTIMPVIGYILDLAAAAFVVSCGAMWMTLKYRPPSSGRETDHFIARVARGQSFVAACSLAGFVATAVVRESFGMSPGAVGGLILLLPASAGLLIWFGLGRLMRKLKMEKE
jgi:hypothetical protein